MFRIFKYQVTRCYMSCSEEYLFTFILPAYFAIACIVSSFGAGNMNQAFSSQQSIILLLPVLTNETTPIIGLPFPFKPYR